MLRTTGCTTTPRGWEQQETREEDLVAVLFVEDSDRRESWLNCGALIYDQRMPTRRYRSCPPLIGTLFADDEASGVLSSYVDIILSETGVHMKMLGPGDKDKLLETCRNIVIENKSNTDTNGDAVSQIYSTFFYSTVTDVSIMQSAILDHYVMMETEELDHLRTVFEEMDSEATVIMIRTPYHRGGGGSSSSSKRQ